MEDPKSLARERMRARMRESQQERWARVSPEERRKNTAPGRLAALVNHASRREEREAAKRAARVDNLRAMRDEIDALLRGAVRDDR